jgi:hypothetical protein
MGTKQRVAAVVPVVAMAASCHAAQDQAISENVGSKRNEFYE